MEVIWGHDPPLFAPSFAIELAPRLAGLGTTQDIHQLRFRQGSCLHLKGATPSCKKDVSSNNWNILKYTNFHNFHVYIYISLYIIWMVLQSWHFISWNIQTVHQMPIDAVGLSGNLLFPTESDHQRWDTQSGLSTAKRFIFSALYCMFQRQNGYILCFIHTYAR